MECFSADSVSGFALEKINCFERAGKLSLYGAANLVDQQSMALSKFDCGFAIFNVITSKAIELDQDEGGLRLLPAFMSGSEPVQVVLNNLDTFSGSLFLHVTYKDALISEVNELTQAGVDMRMEQVIEHITVSDLQGTLHSEQINITDAIAVLRHIVGLDVLSGGLYHSADVNNDSAVNITDAIAILRHIVGLQVINQINLVSEDYYQQEIAYQNVIDKSSNYEDLEQELKIIEEEKGSSKKLKNFISRNRPKFYSKLNKV